MYSQNARGENGEPIIPASQRPDGTWRKARRVKEGYVPQEEVPLYESKGKQFASKSKPTVISLSSGQVAHETIPGLFIVDDKEKTKTKKRRGKNVEEVTKQLDQVKLTPKQKPAKPEKTKLDTKTKETQHAENNQTADPVKKLKNLKKRLREVEALEEKFKNGLIAKPESDQLTKIQRKPDLLLQIRELEKNM